MGKAEVVNSLLSFSVLTSCCSVSNVSLVFSSLLFFVIKKIVQKTRKKIGVFRFIDGVLGIGFYFATYVIFLYLGFCVIYLLMPALPQESSFVIFMKDCHLQ